MKHIAYDSKAGLTLDGQQINLKTGMPFGEPRKFTSPKDESLQISILAKVLNGDQRAKVIYSVEEALDILKKKIQTYENLSQAYPGLGGFLPLLKVEEGDCSPLHLQQATLSSVENGDLYWSIYALTHVLEQKYPNEYNLAGRYNSILTNMQHNSVNIFYEGNGKVRSLVTVGDLNQ